DGDRDAARAEGLADRGANRAEAAGEHAAAMRAAAVGAEGVAADLVPVAHDQGLAAARAVGRVALGVMHVPGVYVLEPGVERDAARARERGGRRGRQIVHLEVGVEG